MTHTSQMKRYAVVYGKLVQFFARNPARAKGQKYTHPVLHETKRFRTKKDRDAAIQAWEAPI